MVDEIDRLLSVIDDEDLKNLEHLLLNIKIDNSNESNFWNLSWNEIIKSSTDIIRNNISSLGNFWSGSFVLNDGVDLGKETVHGYNLENNTLTDSKERNIMTFWGRRFYDFSRDYSNRRNMDNACSWYRITKWDDDENNGSFYIWQFLNGEESWMWIRLDSDGRLYKWKFSSGFIKDWESTITDNNWNVFDYKRSNGETKSWELITKNGEKYEIDMGKDAWYDFRNNWLVPIKSNDPSENDQGVKVQKYYNCNSWRVETITQIS